MKKLYNRLGIQCKKASFVILLIQFFGLPLLHGQEWNEILKTKPDNILSAYSSGYFGISAAVSGDYMVVGEYRGINHEGIRSGIAYVYFYNGTDWELQAKLSPSDGLNDDSFGASVAISDDAIVVGVREDDDNGYNTGSAYVFEKPEDGWIDMTESSKLLADDNDSGDYFGQSVAVWGGLVVIGAYLDEGGGSVYVFEKSSSGWGDTNQIAKLTADDAENGDRFGGNVAISDDVIVVGAYDDELGSAYVFEKPLDGWKDMTQSFKLTADDGEAGDEFGGSVAISGEIIVVGAEKNDDALVDNDASVGAAYIFKKSDSSWDQVAKLIASDGASYDYFGCDVAIYNDVIVIGAEGDGNNGSAYVFQKPEDGWIDMTEIVKLRAYDGGTSYDYFGSSVAIHEDKIVIGARFDDDNGSNSGSAYIFQELSGEWQNHNGTTSTKLLPENIIEHSEYSYYGRAVAIDGDYAVVGAYGENNSTGGAYVFEFTGSTWEKIAHLNPGNETLYFGFSVAIDEDIIAIGSYGDDDNGTFSGSAYVFEKPSGGWADMTETAKLTANDGIEDDFFGKSVAISGNVIVVGAEGDDNEVGLDGSAYIFEKQNSGWIQLAKLTANDEQIQYSKFGSKVAIFNDVVVIGLNGDEEESGAAYVFEKPADGWIDMTQNAKLTATFHQDGDHFGDEIFIHQELIAVGSNYDQEGNNNGAVYLYEESADGWKNMTQSAVLTASDGSSGDSFGRSNISIYDDMIAVGASNNDYNGSVYIFEKTDNGWTDMNEVDKITASDGYEDDRFGISASISNNMIIIGSYLDNSISEYSGSAYIYALKQNQDISFSTLTDVTYGDANLTFNAVASSDLPVSYTSSDENVVAIDENVINIVGTGDVTITASQLGNDLFYYAATSVDQSLIINKAPLTATADDQRVTIGDNLPEFSIAYSGFVNGEGETVLDVAPTASVSTTEALEVGNYDIIVSGGSDNNYEFSYTNGTLTISEVLGIFNENAITVYPNPTFGEITIDIREVGSVEIYDSKGILLTQFSSKDEVDISNLATGSYLLMIKGPSGTVLSANRIIKK